MNYSPRYLFGFRICFLIYASTGNAQKNELSLKERELSVQYATILKYTGEQFDSAFLYSNKFGKAFKTLIATNPSTIAYPFKTLIDSNYCHIVTSADGNFRIYSWDNCTGGTMHYFEQIYQFK